jgi:hypothetical protein
MNMSLTEVAAMTLGTNERVTEVDEWSIDFFFLQSPKLSPNSKGLFWSSSVRPEMSN